MTGAQISSAEVSTGIRMGVLQRVIQGVSSHSNIVYTKCLELTRRGGSLNNISNFIEDLHWNSMSDLIYIVKSLQLNVGEYR